MRRHQDEALDPLVRMLAGVDRRDRGAVAVSKQDPALEPDRIEHRGQAEPRLAAHVIERTRQIDALGCAVAGARIGEHPMARRRREFRRKVAPERDATEPLVQHDDRRRLIRRRTIGDRLQALAVGDDVVANARDPWKVCHSAEAPTGDIELQAGGLWSEEGSDGCPCQSVSWRSHEALQAFEYRSPRR